MIINDIDYEINTNCRMRIYNAYKKEQSEENQEAFVIEILIPHPSHEDYGEFGLDDIEEILLEFALKQKKKDTEFKKKLSR